MKRILITLSVIISSLILVSSASAANGWMIDNPGGGEVEISEGNSIKGKALHIDNTDSGDITVTHLIAGTGSVRNNFRVTFYMSGSYDEEKIMVGTGTKTTASNPDAITYMSVSNEKVEKTELGNGWIKYSYIFRGSVSNNSEFKFVFGSGCGEAFVDNVSIVYESSTDGAYNFTGAGLLADGEFEDEITADSGFDIEEYGWKSNLDSVSTSGVATAGSAITPVARVVEDEEGNRMLYVKYNSNAWNNTGLMLTKTIGKTGWEYYYVTFKVKGAFNPGSVEVGSVFDDQLKKLACDDKTSSADKPYGDFVEVEDLGDGWTKYTVKTYGEGTVFRIKIHSQALEMYFDDFEVITAAGVKPELKNPGFDNVDYDPEKIFAEGWTAMNSGENAFAQREKANDGYKIFLTSDSNDNKSGFYQTIEGINVGETYTVNFDARTSFAKSGIKVGFGKDSATVNGKTFSDITSGMTRYSFSAEATADKLIFITNGECNGVWIDNVSVTDSEGNEIIVNGDFEIKTQPPVYTVENIKLMKGGLEADLGQGSYSVTADVENNFGEEDMEFTIILSHDRNGEMIKYSQESITLNPNGEDGNATSLSCSIDLSDYIEGDKLEVYIWDNDIDKNPLVPCTILN